MLKRHFDTVDTSKILNFSSLRPLARSPRAWHSWLRTSATWSSRWGVEGLGRSWKVLESILRFSDHVQIFQIHQPVRLSHSCAFTTVTFTSHIPFAYVHYMPIQWVAFISGFQRCRELDLADLAGLSGNPWDDISSDSMDWFKENLTEHLHISREIPWFPEDFPWKPIRWLMLGPALNLDVTLLWGSQLCNELACASLCKERPNCHGADIGRHPHQQQERENGGHQSMPPGVVLQMFFCFFGGKRQTPSKTTQLQRCSGELD